VYLGQTDDGRGYVFQVADGSGARAASLDLINEMFEEVEAKVTVGPP
jgi:hypothetical protein